MLLPTLLTEFPHKLFDDILYRIQKMMSKAASIDFLGLKRVKKYKKISSYKKWVLKNSVVFLWMPPIGSTFIFSVRVGKLIMSS